MTDRLERADGVSVRYGPLVVRFETTDPSARFVLRRPHTAFVEPDSASADCIVRCELESPRPLPVAASFAPAEHDWELRLDPAGGDEVSYLAMMPSGRREPRQTIHLSPDLRQARVRLRPRHDTDREIPIDFPMDEYVATRLLGRRGHVVVHGCTLADGAGAIVCVGHSGAGKSTIAELAESVGAEVLSDDRTVLTVEDGRVLAWGTPWHGSYRRGLPRSAVVRGIVLLVQDAGDSVRPMHPSHAFAELFVRTIQPTTDAGEVERVIDALQRIVGVVPMSSLHFRPTTEAYLLARKWVDAIGRNALRERPDMAGVA